MGRKKGRQSRVKIKRGKQINKWGEKAFPVNLVVSTYRKKAWKSHHIVC
jgi:hypothetical protein